MSLLQEMQKHGLADCEHNRKLINQERNEYISAVMSGQLLFFCRDNDLPFESADELLLREGLTDFEFGWLAAYCKIWEGLIE